MSHKCYFAEEENAKEESINNYIDLFFEFKANPPNLKEALYQLFISGGVPENEINDYINDIFKKANSVFDNNDRKKKILEKYPFMTLEDAQIITSYTCEAKKHMYSPYLIMNKNLVKDDRKQGIENVSKYFYLLLITLRKLPRYYPKNQLYRCIPKKVTLYNPSNKKFVPYEIGNQKTFWAFTSTSLKFENSYKFLGKNNDIDDEEYKSGTIFSLSGNIWGYDITVLSHYPKEEEILLEPERKYIIKEVIPNVNDITIIRGEFEDTSIILQDIKLTNELIYKVDEDGFYQIFGYLFVVNNENNIDLIINGEETPLQSIYSDLKKGENSIKLIIKNKLTNLSWMFGYSDGGIKNIELKNLDVSNGREFFGMFYDCSWLRDTNVFLKWNVSKGNNFGYMFSGCSSLSNLEGLKNWNVSNGNNFIGMFYDCTSLSDIKALQNWNVSNGKYFNEMFKGCSSLSDINGLQNWNVSNGNQFNAMFYNCISLSDINALQNWNVSNAKTFMYMFGDCSSLSNIKALQNWNVSNVEDFEFMFLDCSSLSDIKALQNWNVSNGLNFSFIFKGCTLSDKKPLDNWFKVNKYLEQNSYYIEGMCDKK